MCYACDTKDHVAPGVHALTDAYLRGMFHAYYSAREQVPLKLCDICRKVFDACCEEMSVPTPATTIALSAEERAGMN